VQQHGQLPSYGNDSSFLGILSSSLGYAIARSWSGPIGLWLALFVTGFIPAGYLAPFITLVVKLKQVSQGHL
jgi:hypothetical protein